MDERISGGPIVLIGAGSKNAVTNETRQLNSTLRPCFYLLWSVNKNGWTPRQRSQILCRWVQLVLPGIEVVPRSERVYWHYSLYVFKSSTVSRNLLLFIDDVSSTEFICDVGRLSTNSHVLMAMMSICIFSTRSSLHVEAGKKYVWRMFFFSTRMIHLHGFLVIQSGQHQWRMGVVTAVFRCSSIMRQWANCVETNLHQVYLAWVRYLASANNPACFNQSNRPFRCRYLDVYERVHFLGEEVDRRELEHHEEDDARNRRKALRLLHATPTSYNASQHVVPGIIQL